MTSEELAYNKGWNDLLNLILNQLPALHKELGIPEPIQDVENGTQFIPMAPPPPEAIRFDEPPKPFPIPREVLESMPVLPVAIKRPGG